MTSLAAKVIAIEQRGDQYQVIVQITTKYRGSFNTLASGEIKPYSGSLKDARLDLVYFRDPGLEVGDPFPLWTLLPVAFGTPFFHPLALMSSNKSFFGVNLGHMWHETNMIAGWMEVLLKGIADGWVRPHVDKSFPLAQAGAAQTYMEERRNIGKVVLKT